MTPLYFARNRQRELIGILPTFRTAPMQLRRRLFLANCSTTGYSIERRYAAMKRPLLFALTLFAVFPAWTWLENYVAWADDPVEPASVASAGPHAVEDVAGRTPAATAPRAIA